MSALDFPADLATELGYEGGFVNDPQDPGGATNLGVTIATLSHWEGHPATVAEIRALSPGSVAPIYRSLYWNAVRGDDLPAGVDLLVFDTAINSGPRRAAEFLQQAVGVTADGWIGPGTLAAVAAKPVADVIEAFSAEHEAFYRSLPTFPHFGHGWLNRLAAVKARARQLAGV